MSKVVKNKARSPGGKGKTGSRFGTKANVLQCRESKSRPTVRLNVAKPKVSLDMVDRSREDGSSLDDFVVPPSKVQTVPTVQRRTARTAMATTSKPSTAAVHDSDGKELFVLVEDDVNKVGAHNP